MCPVCLPGSPDWAFLDFIENNIYLLVSVPFFFLTWASGYMTILLNRARKRRWGLSILNPSKWPMRTASQFAEDFDEEP
jgi:hypothetical protein